MQLSHPVLTLQALVPHRRRHIDIQAAAGLTGLHELMRT